MRRTGLVVVMCFLYSLAIGQEIGDIKNWQDIDLDVRLHNRLSDVVSKLARLNDQAIAENRNFLLARVRYTRALIDDSRSEDSFYFHNSRFIDSFLAIRDLPADLQVAMHLLQARRLLSFKRMRLKFNEERYERTDVPVNYGAFSTVQRDSIIDYHFKAARQLSLRISDINVPDALWFAPDPFGFLFRPSLFDIVTQAHIAMQEYVYPNVSARALAIDIIGGSPDQLIAWLDTLYALDHNLLALRSYSEWLRVHQNEPAIYYYIESLARNTLFGWLQRAEYSGTADERYRHYLEASTSSPYGMVRAQAVLQLCLIWNADAKKYFPDPGYRYPFSSNNSPVFDTTYGDRPLRALRLMEKNEAILDSFGYIKDALFWIKKEILSSDFSIQLRSNQSPDSASLAKIIFTNVDTIYYRLVRLRAYQSLAATSEKEIRSILTGLPEIRSGHFSLPPINDHNRHSAYGRIDPLPTGFYAIEYSDRPLSETNATIRATVFSVSSLELINVANRILAINRLTGFPEKGIGIAMGDFFNPANFTPLRRATDGWAIIPVDGQPVIRLVSGNDSFYRRVNASAGDDRPSDAFDKSEDDLLEYYSDNTVPHIYTDRSIYRPGQKLHYKVIFLTHNRKTGETMVLNKHNLRELLVINVLRKFLKEDNPYLYIRDPFNHTTDSIKIVLSDYGSLSGDYLIPKTAPTGEWNITTDYYDDEGGSFRVEEYKRPTYEMAIESSKKLLLPGDSFAMVVKLKSFAGAALNNVRIRYTLEKTEEMQVFDSISAKYDRQAIRSTLADSSGFTDKNGELSIPIVDSLLSKFVLPDDTEWTNRYTLSASAVDATGESIDKNETIKISSWPIRITMPVREKYNAATENTVNVSIAYQNRDTANKPIRVRIFKDTKSVSLVSSTVVKDVDTWLYPRDSVYRWFPDTRPDHSDSTIETLVLDTIFKTGQPSSLFFDQRRFQNGKYFVRASVEINGRIVGLTERRFEIFSVASEDFADAASFHYLPINVVDPGKKIEYYYGMKDRTTYNIFYVQYYSRKHGASIRKMIDASSQPPGIHNWTWTLPRDAQDQVSIDHLYMVDGKAYSNHETIYIAGGNADQPEIIVESYRKKLVPGERQAFTVSIKTKNVNKAAELMTTLYDASLDKLEEHAWTIPRERRIDRLESNWNLFDNNYAQEYILSPNDNYAIDSAKFRESKPLWWLWDAGPGELSLMGDWNLFRGNAVPTSWGYINDKELGQSLSGRLAGLYVTSSLNEVVVVGYGSSKKRDLTGAVVTIRGASSLTNYKQLLIILDGVRYEGDLATIDPAVITQGLVLKGADAVAIYGSLAANGVLVLSTKGPIILPEGSPADPVPVRKNFNETAFFFPSIHASRDGYYHISFEMPESVTEWNWKMLAHTKNATFVYAERKLVTQLPLMVQPNVPRVLYQGDRIVLQSRISNLDTIVARGEAGIRIEDEMTGEEITASMVRTKSQAVSVAGKEQGAVAFELRVPASQLNPIRITITARSASFADGEEHVIPVLSPAVFIRDSRPFAFEKMDTVISVGTVPPDAKLYGAGLSISPKPQAALINSLPYLANYSFDCAEQLSNKIVANLIALKIMRIDSLAQKSFTAAKISSDADSSRSSALPDDLSENAMPWLRLSSQLKMQQSQLFYLFDTSRTTETVSGHLEKLYKLQNADGGLSWFPNGKTNLFMSTYVMGVFGQLLRQDMLRSQSIFGPHFNDFVSRLIAYCDQAAANANVRGENATTLAYAYARGLWLTKYPLSEEERTAINAMLMELLRKRKFIGLYQQAKLIVTCIRLNDAASELNRMAKELLQSIRELAIYGDQGIRWKDIADADDLNTSTEEILSTIAEAFEVGGSDPEIGAGIIKWLMTMRTEHSWRTTKATSAIVTLLSRQNANVTGETTSITASINDESMSVSNDLLSGNTFSFSRQAEVPASIRLHKNDDRLREGFLHWYYFTGKPPAAPKSGGLSIDKRLEHWNETGNEWEPVAGNAALKIGDRVRVTLTITNSAPLRFLYLDDKRSGALEPVDNNSDYDYEGDLGYYRSVRDASMQFFLDFMPSGRHEINYECKLSQEGSFTNGVASLQCMYRPEMNAYSDASSITISR